MDNQKIFQEVALRHMEIEQAVDIMLWNDYKTTWKYRFLKWIGCEPYRAINVQCSLCLAWRKNNNISNNLWLSDNGVIKCPECQFI